MILSNGVNRLLNLRHYFPKQLLPHFAWGWIFYFIIYFAGRLSGVHVDVIRAIYTLTTIGVPVLFLVFHGVTQQRLKLHFPSHSKTPLDFGSLSLSLLFVLAMIYVGPYLEFPSDPLEHLSRIQAWESIQWMDTEVDHLLSRSTTFVYFLNHWILQGAGVDWGDRQGLAIFCAALQGVLFWSFIRFSLIFTARIKIAWFGALLSVGFFGKDVFNYYSYYVLSASFPAYLLFLEGLILLCYSFIHQRLRYLFLLPPILAFCWHNHPQEVLLLLNTGAGLSILLSILHYRQYTSPFRKWMLGTAIMSGSCLMGVGGYLIVNPELRGWGPWARIMLVEKQVWSWPVRYLRFQELDTTLGIFGWGVMMGSGLVLFLARYCSKRLVLLAALSAWPLLTLWNPFIMEVFEWKVRASATYYRILYSSCFWILGAILLETLYNQIQLTIPFQWSRFHIPYAKQLKILVVLIGCLGLLELANTPHPPIRGKLKQLRKKPHPALDGMNLQATIAYLRQNAPQRCHDIANNQKFKTNRSYIVADRYVSAYLLTTGRFYIAIAWKKEYQHFQKEACYIVIYAQNNAPASWVGEISRHWTPKTANTSEFYADFLSPWIAKNAPHFQPVFADGNILVLANPNPGIEKYDEERY
ncbi:hypothetical protein WDW89_08110 [Deltaproteobacteria bacterium TL4]